MIDYLFDRIIDVTIVRRDASVIEEKKQVTAIKSPQITATSKLKATVSSSEDPSAIVMTFWEGTKHTEYVLKEDALKGTTKQYKKIIRGNPLFRFSVATKEDMYKGNRPDGSLYQTGDIITVREDLSTWHVAVSYGENASNVISKVTETSLTELPNTVINIKCPDSGRKPTISLGVSLIPGQACYKAVLKIHNLNIDKFSIRAWSEMKIVAGYRGAGPKLTLRCPIYTSYVESPNPDGVTVFEGLTVGEVSDVFRDTPIRIRFNAKEISIGKFLATCAPGISSHMRINNSLNKKINDFKIKINVSQDYYVGSGLALLNWMQTTLGKIIQEQFGGQLVMQVINGVLQVFALNTLDNILPKLKESIISLDCVYGATFNGSALTVKAAWNPRLLPGDLFYMPPEYINASRLPNTIASSYYKNDDNLYRIITMNINFSTTENTNEMEILALPAQYIGQSSMTTVDTEISPNQYASYLEKRVNEMGNVYPIEIGISEDASKSITKQETSVKTGNQMIDNGRTAEAMITTVSSIVPSGATLSTLCYSYYKEKGLDYSIKSGGGAGRLWKAKEDLPTNIPKAHFAGYENNGVSAWLFAVPLVATVTWWRKYNEDKAGTSHNWDTIDPDSIGTIHAGKSLLLPNINGFTSFSTIKDIWKYAYKEYSDISKNYAEEYKEWAKAWRMCYYYLGGTEVLE